jgi:hypothetical protein
LRKSVVWWLNDIGWLVVWIIGFFLYDWWISSSQLTFIFLRGVGQPPMILGVECGWMWLNVVECPFLMGKNESCSMLSSWRMGIPHVTMKWLLWMVAKSCTTKGMVESL